ncbi:MAG: hypothetical protein M1821_006555 [Bathelium mastoideum]|nr:MAG: hypothetical protein M1821_006555 [Bathelium mastoideum]KAI9693830.1 MAG: hypothetical protein M1822_003101 [Bathelium mastoideum]
MRNIPRTFSIPSSKGPLNINLEAPAVIAQNLVLEAWSSSHILTQHLQEITPDLEPALATLPKSRYETSGGTNGDERVVRNGSSSTSPSAIGVLELGAGVGLVGLAASALWSTHVTLTDLSPIVEPIFSNIKLNAETLAATGGSASAGALDWDEPDTLILRTGNTLRTIKASNLGLEDRAKIILAADVIYYEEHPRMLTNAILAWLSPHKDARVVIAYPLRVAYLDQIRELWDRLEKGGLVSFREGRAKAGDNWDDEEEIEWCVWKWKAAH